MSVPVIIISGFLGCGKTSFLRHLLPLCGEAGLRPALIINEVGDVDVDGELLADLQAAQSLLVGGCVCCTLQAQLATTVQDVLDRQAGDLIIIECSGLSNPLDVVGVLSTPMLLSRVAVSHVICLLDARRGPILLKAAELARAQVATADVLIFNKADTIAEAERPGVEATVAALAPAAER
ncbi:MAG TPA: GTP-binding protein, partial [Armatimonadota bacterium]